MVGMNRLVWMEIELPYILLLKGLMCFEILRLFSFSDLESEYRHRSIGLLYITV